jgi:hypothetical protein
MDPPNIGLRAIVNASLPRPLSTTILAHRGAEGRARDPGRAARESLRKFLKSARLRREGGCAPPHRDWRGRAVRLGCERSVARSSLGSALAGGGWRCCRGTSCRSSASVVAPDDASRPDHRSGVAKIGQGVASCQCRRRRFGLHAAVGAQARMTPLPRSSPPPAHAPPAARPLGRRRHAFPRSHGPAEHKVKAVWLTLRCRANPPRTRAVPRGSLPARVQRTSQINQSNPRAAGILESPPMVMQQTNPAHSPVAAGPAFRRRNRRLGR